MPTITVDMDKKCSKCGEEGALVSGICMSCASESVKQRLQRRNQMITLSGFIEKINTGVDKDGHVIVKLTLVHDLTASGVLSTVGELVAIQDKGVECSIETTQGTLPFKKVEGSVT